MKKKSHRSANKIAIAGSKLLTGLMICAVAAAQQPSSIETKVDNLLKQMTLEEKVGQMAQVSVESLGQSGGGSFSFNKEKLKDAVVNYKIGSILNTPGVLLDPKSWNAVIHEIQENAKTTKLKIPVLYGLDDIHGVSYASGTTLFPQQ